jgi:histidine triad (HIT) family protein
MTCEHCETISGKKESATLYSDDKLIAFLSPQPATIGHIIIAPKAHLPIMEALDDKTVEHIFKVANKISIALFESIKCEGTNLIVQNGTAAGQEAPHFSVNVIARRGGDGFVFDWAPKQLSEEEMATLELQLREELSKAPEKKPEPELKEEKQAEKKEEGKVEGKEAEEKKEEDENYLVKQLKRMP